MTATYDITNNVGKIRLYIQDTDTTDTIFTDEEIQVFIDATSSLRYAAAMALRAIASSTARLAVRVKTLNYEEDTKTVAAGILSAADAFEAMEDNIPYAVGAEQSLTDFTTRQIQENEIERTYG